MNAAPDLELIEVSGSPRQMGESFGEALRQQTRELYERRLQAAIDYAHANAGREYDGDAILAIARRCLPITERYDPQGYAEFLGIARGAGLSAAQLFVTQGLTDLRDVLAFGSAADVDATCLAADDSDAADAGAEGCSAFAVAPGRTREGRLLVGQTWDLATDNMPYVRLVRRRPEDAPQTLSLTLTGCLTLIGLNEAGVAVGNTNLRTRDARLGLQYLSILHRALRCRQLDEAVTCIAEAPRSAGHFYYAANAEGRMVGLECSATRCHRFDIEDDGVFVHCNHALSDSIRRFEASITYDSTEFRQRRMSELLEGGGELLDVQRIKGVLSDRQGGDLAICRYCTGPFDISTNAAVIMNPATGEMHACRAQPDYGVWRTERVG